MREKFKKFKTSFIFVTLFCLLISPFSWAADENLIRLLHEKKYLTDAEAARLLEEAKQRDKKGKEEIKKDIQDEVKKVSLPSALKGLSVRSTIFFYWENKSAFRGNDANLNRFVLERAYFTIAKDLSEHLSMNVTADLFTSRDAQDEGNGLELRVKYAYADVKYFGTSTKLGMIPTPSDAYDSSIWPYRVQGKHLLDALGIMSSADIGVSNQFNIGEMDKEYYQYGSRTFGGKWGGWLIGVYNGPGYNNPEKNNNKVVSGLVYIRPLPMVPILKGLQLAYIGTYGLSNRNFTNVADGPLTDYPTWRVNIAHASLVHPYFTLMGQYYWGKATSTSTEEKNRKAYMVAGFVRVPKVEKLRIFGKYYTYDPNTDLVGSQKNKKDEYQLYAVGLSYDWSKEFMPFVAWEREDNKSYSTRIDYNRYQVGFQLRF
ncbi:MAG: hypothetical protein N2572_00660 [Syntrophales bacterium]|nr:hypothetical protein [Syntrophales bacterium]